MPDTTPRYPGRAPIDAYGNGGCGTMYLQGAPSTVYTDPSKSCESVAAADKTDFGPAVLAPPPAG